MWWEPGPDRSINHDLFPPCVQPLSHSFAMGLPLLNHDYDMWWEPGLDTIYPPTLILFQVRHICFMKDFFVNLFLWFKHKTLLIFVFNHNKSHYVMINHWAPPLLFILPSTLLHHSTTVRSNPFKSMTLIDFGLVLCPSITRPKSNIPLFPLLHVRLRLFRVTPPKTAHTS